MKHSRQDFAGFPQSSLRVNEIAHGFWFYLAAQEAIDWGFGGIWGWAIAPAL